MRLKKPFKGYSGIWQVSAVAGFTTLVLGAFAEETNWDSAKQFWSFQNPQKHSRPVVRDMSWPRERIDFFLLNAMEASGLTPTPDADGRTLIRRLTFDLTGLPPTPDEVVGFLSNPEPTAYEDLVDRLMNSPRFGERMASMWLNVARYAEDQAHQVGSDIKHFYPNAYRYRDWVIRAFNQDLPYDEFIRLQLAADKFKPDSKEDLAALGFIGLGPKYYNRGRLDVKADEWEDRVDTVSRSFLGLTVACARCHDHKFDPITMEDYYGLAGVFASTEMWNMPFDKTMDELTEEEKKKANLYAIHIVKDGEPQDLNVFLRGDVERKGPVVPRRFLQVLSDGSSTTFQRGSGRQELAEAIARRENPLTARVFVNRIWGLMFGQPLVSSPSNFGSLGGKPSHPKLLDDLAVGFVENGWSVKGLIREMALSSAYRQATDDSPENLAIDPANKNLWKMNRRRLTVEQWRDSVLAVSGNLDLQSGRSLDLLERKNHRRTVHARISRLKLNDLLMNFDYPDANVHSAERAVTTTPVQKLFAMNSPFMLEQAEALSKRLQGNTESDRLHAIDRAYQLLFARGPTQVEIAAAEAFLKRPDTTSQDRWTLYAQALLASNEMLYID